MNWREPDKPSKKRLFNPTSPAAVRARTQRGYVIAFAGTAVVIAALVGGLHYEEAPFLAYLLAYCPEAQPFYDCEYPSYLDWLAALIAFVVAGPFLAWLVKVRRIPPTVTCLGCGATGWIMDLEPTEGRCPLCAHDRFRYRGLQATGVPVMKIWRMDDIGGADLLDLCRSQDML